ncbi:MAG: cbb3-type cytochrome oxidase assembly protein CcoS [Polyangiales bacterium]
MEVLILLIFVSLVLAVLGVLFFVWNVARGTFDHADRMTLLPLAEDTKPTTETSNDEQ